MVRLTLQSWRTQKRSVMVKWNETGDKSPPVALRARRLIPLDPRAGFDACLHSHGDPPRSLLDADDGSSLHSHDVLHRNGTNGRGGRDEGLRQQTWKASSDGAREEEAPKESGGLCLQVSRRTRTRALTSS